LFSFAIDAFGAQGGTYGASGGLGGYITVSSISAAAFTGKTLYINVGGNADYNGYNVGASTSWAVSEENFTPTCGGGATSISLSSIVDLTNM